MYTYIHMVYTLMTRVFDWAIRLVIASEIITFPAHIRHRQETMVDVGGVKSYIRDPTMGCLIDSYLRNRIRTDESERNYNER